MGTNIGFFSVLPTSLAVRPLAVPLDMCLFFSALVAANLGGALLYLHRRCVFRPLTRCVVARLLRMCGAGLGSAAAACEVDESSRKSTGSAVLERSRSLLPPPPLEQPKLTPDISHPPRCPAASYLAHDVAPAPPILLPTLCALAAGRAIKAFTESLTHQATPAGERHLSALVGVRLRI